MGSDDAMSNAFAAEMKMNAKGIHNAEIHITRADPNKHDGKEGFVYSITWSQYHLRDDVVHYTRSLAAMEAAFRIDELEKGLIDG
jgi:7-cyano-7-deazaguanine synthase in queuosine biosynthesis